MKQETGEQRKLEDFVCFASFNEMKLLSRDVAGRWKALRNATSFFF